MKRIYLKITVVFAAVALITASCTKKIDEAYQSPNADVNTFRAQNSNRNTYSDVSSISSVGSDKEGRKRLARRTITGASTRTGNTEVEEARDGFDETLAPSPNFTTSDAGAARIGSPTRESRFREVGL